MPPVVEVLKENLKVLSDDPAIAGYAKSPLVFTDVTFALNNLERTVVIRHLDGKLVEAPFEVRKRVSQIYNPMPGRKLSEPRMFEPDNLNRILEEGEYTFILDNLCLHFEPFEAKFHEISSKVYQHVNENLKFDSLRSTRHFGPMAFFLAWHKIIDDLLIDMIRNDFLKNGVELICLLFKIKGIEADTSILEKLQEIDEIELLINRTVDAMLSKLDENKIQKTNEDLQIDELCFAFIQNSYYLEQRDFDFIVEIMTALSKINKDIKEEREKVKFNIEEFTNWYYGGADKVEEKRFLENFFLSDPELQDKVSISYLSHKEKYEEAIRKSTLVFKKIRDLQAQGRDGVEIYMALLGGMLGTSLLREGNPMSVHYVMFLPALMNHGTGDQQAEWISKAWNCNVIGTYAQTEMGHGTFIRGLETTATYDPKTKEFIINSPTITAYKWWPGGLGHTANYAIVIAQLYSLGQHHGIQPFIVQLRDEETHQPLPGITIGEIGNKVGMNTVNNGFLGFNNVRIPLHNMLMKNAKVLENGEFIKPKSSVLTYGTMMFVRVVILKDMAAYLSKAVTIAMRYSTVRRQSPIDPNQPEPKIIEHVTQQMKIFPAIAKVIVFKITAELLWEMYNQVTHELDKGDLERLPELHALACCLKAVCTNEATQAVQTCRLACGGHGYLNSSGFNDIYGSVTAAQTYEGENTVLFLQTARYLIKAWNQALNGEKLTPTVAYLKNYTNNLNQRDNWDGSPKGILRALQSTAAHKIALAHKHLEARKKFCSAEEAANQTGIELSAAAEVHCQAFLLHSAIEVLENAAKHSSPALAVVFRDVLELYAVDLAIRSLGHLLQFVNLKSIDIETLQGRLESALKKFKSSAIGIVDGFDIPDPVLGSTLGAYDGNVYERLLDAAKSSPLNQEDVNKSFHLYLKPFMKSNL
ncbi:CLUMA_CG008994, isoform A [Clunio marinus]|uniref:acyl-CoA oxidase n=1 Tax=Clunio marinus TaxID=568069 RepID=A0A1J1I5F6_9DIPT|nr:CLUMA_CG008994, isoform A [Clunio marinus]